MDGLRTRISDLSDEDAIAALALVLDGQDVPYDEWRLNEVQERLPEAFSTPEVQAEITPPAAGSVSRGDLARSTLLYLAEQHPELQGETSRAVDQPRRVGTRDPLTIAIAGLVVLALQTEIELSRNDKGRWSFTFHKRPSQDSRLGEILGGLASLVGGGK